MRSDGYAPKSYFGAGYRVRASDACCVCMPMIDIRAFIRVMVVSMLRTRDCSVEACSAFLNDGPARDVDD